MAWPEFRRPPFACGRRSRPRKFRPPRSRYVGEVSRVTTCFHRSSLRKKASDPGVCRGPRFTAPASVSWPRCSRYSARSTPANTRSPAFWNSPVRSLSLRFFAPVPRCCATGSPGGSDPPRAKSWGHTGERGSPALRASIRLYRTLSARNLICFSGAGGRGRAHAGS